MNTFLATKKIEEAMNTFYSLLSHNVKPNEFTFGKLYFNLAQTKHIKYAREILDYQIKANIPLNVISGNVLISFFSKCEKQDLVELVYKTIARHTKPNEITFLSTLSGISNHKQFEFCQLVLQDFNKSDISPNLKLRTVIIAAKIRVDDRTASETYENLIKDRREHSLVLYLTLITACSDVGNFKLGKMIYDDMIGSQLIPDAPLLNASIKLLLLSGDEQEAHRLFDRFGKACQATTSTYVVLLSTCTKVQSWDFGNLVAHKLMTSSFKYEEKPVAALINMYMKQGDADKAVQIYKSHRHNFSPSSWVVLLTAVADAGDADFSALLCDDVQVSTVSVKNAKLRMLLKVERTEDAFQEYEDTTVEPDEITFGIIIEGCTKTGNFVFGRRVVADLARRNIAWSLQLKTIIVKFYIHSGDLSKAAEMHKERGNVDILYYGSLLNACANTLNLNFGKKLIEELQREKLECTTTVSNIIINLYLKCNDIWSAQEVYNNINKHGHSPNNVTYMTLLMECANTGNFEFGMRVYKDMMMSNLKVDTVLLTLVCGMLIKCGRIDDALEIEEKMIHEGPKPDEHMYISMMLSCAEIAAQPVAKKLHDLVLKRGYSSVKIDNALLMMYGRCGPQSVDKALQIFHSSEQDSTTYSTMIYILSLHRCVDKALDLLEEMKMKRLKIDHFALVGALNACSHGNRVDEALQLINDAETVYHITPDLQLHNIVVDTLARAGHLDQAEEYATKMTDTNIVTYMAILSGCKKFRDVQRAERVSTILFKKTPDSAAAYILLGNIYGQDLMWDKRKQVMDVLETKDLKKVPGRSSVYIGTFSEQHEDRRFYGRSYTFVVEDEHLPFKKEVAMLLNETRIRLENE
jgi:pentatricopeptide repeat protein